MEVVEVSEVQKNRELNSVRAQRTHYTTSSTGSRQFARLTGSRRQRLDRVRQETRGVYRT